MNIDHAHTVLANVFGFASFRPGQAEIVEEVLGGRDVLVILPTGGGKSICYQVPGLVLGGTTLVISPLISLMKDQVDHLVAKNIPATFLNSSLEKAERELRLSGLKSGEYRFLYLSPESLQTKWFEELRSVLDVRLIAIDEAHCISQWGREFRPEYFAIATAIGKFMKRPVVMALTASAPPQVQQEICLKLKLQKPRIFLNSFVRKNLQISVRKCLSQTEQLLLLYQCIKNAKESSILIYCQTREQTEQLSRFLSNFKVKVAAYHGGMETSLRTKVQDAFLKDEYRLIVATNAFGMGVDKPNIRLVIHMGMSSSLENYYQEIGRAGRDGQPATCLLLYTQKDLDLQNVLTHSREGSNPLKVHHHQLSSFMAYINTKHCRMKALVGHFSEKFDHCHNCDNCQRRYSRYQPLTVFNTSQKKKFDQLLRKRNQQSRLIPQSTIAWMVMTGNAPGLGKFWQKNR